MISYAPLRSDENNIDPIAALAPVATTTQLRLEIFSEFRELNPNNYSDDISNSPLTIPSQNEVWYRGTSPFPIFSVILVFAISAVFYSCDYSNCSQPLAGWSLAYVCRHLMKTILYSWRMNRSNSQSTPMGTLGLLCIALVDLSGPTVWSLGGYFIFRADACSKGIFVFASILWGIQSISLLLPCCFLSTIIFCAPCLLWLAPYIVRPNPNQVATSREILSRIPKLKYGDLSESQCTSCSICLGDYLPDDEVMQLPCQHLFHSACIQEWLKLSQLCAICRSNIVALLVNSEIV